MTRVSVVCASFNKGRFIGATVESVLAQTHRELELMIVDDCSTDNTISVIEKFKNSDDRVHIIRNETNRGANYCRNVGLNHATGELILFLDADDLLGAHCVETRLARFRDHPKAAFGVFSMAVFNSIPGDMNYVWNPRSRAPLDDFLQHSLPWTIIQPLWKRDFLISLKGFDESFDRLQDVEMHSRAMLAAPDYFMSPGDPDCFVRVSEERKSMDDDSLMQRWVAGSLRFTDKFVRLVSVRKRRLLSGTLFMTYLELLLRRKRKTLSPDKFLTLEHQLLNHPMIRDYSVRRLILLITKFYNLRLGRIPGGNRLLKVMLTAVR